MLCVMIIGTSSELRIHVVLQGEDGSSEGLASVISDELMQLVLLCVGVFSFKIKNNRLSI